MIGLCGGKSFLDENFVLYESLSTVFFFVVFFYKITNETRPLIYIVFKDIVIQMLGITDVDDVAFVYINLIRPNFKTRFMTGL